MTNGDRNIATLGEFFALVGEPGGNYANSPEEWQERSQGKTVTLSIGPTFNGELISPSAIEVTECLKCAVYHPQGAPCD